MHDPAPEPLSERQAEIAAMVARGKSNREIALELNLSPRTVDAHLAAIFTKLRVRSRVELTVARSHPAAESRAVRARPNNLPLEVTSFIGRESELSELAALIERRRLVTLTGAGGVGKTRLALRVGAAMLGRFRHGVWLVDLAPVADAYLAEAIAAALSVRIPPNNTPLEALGENLHKKTLLLILDNCEHVVAEAAPLTDTLLRSCPCITILATSRESLKVAGEQAYRVPSLDVPPLAPERTSLAAKPKACDSVTLFVERAQSADHRFAATDSNVPIIGQICRQLDGIPLAIELVAARVNAMSLASLAHALERRFRLITAGDRAAAPRHQTMSSLIDWSYDLLSEDERRLFERLSVFAGGCVLEAAAAVYSDGTADEPSVLHLLSSLVDRSLVVADLRDPEPRYGLLQTTRDYARNKLAARGVEAIVARRHAVAFVNLAERLHADPLGIVELKWATRVRCEFENWKLALTWTLGTGNDIALGQRLVAALNDVWAASSLVEGRRWTRLAMESVDEHTPAIVTAHIRYAWAGNAYLLRDYEVAFRDVQPLIAGFRQLGDPLQSARAQHLAGRTLVNKGRIAEGEPLLRLALEAARSLGNMRFLAVVLESIGMCRSQLGDTSAARAYLSEAVTIFQALGTENYVAHYMMRLADVESVASNVEQAVELATAALALLRKCDGELWPTINVLINLALYLVACDRWDEARARAREALDLAREVGQNYYLTYALKHLAATIALAPPANADHNGARFATVARLLGYIDAHLESLGANSDFSERREYVRLVNVLIAALPNEEFVRLMTDGAAMTADQAVEEALRY